MIGESIRAILLGGLPVAVFTFLVLQWSIASGRLEVFADSQELQKQFKDRKKARAEKKKTEKAAKTSGVSATGPQTGKLDKPAFYKDLGRDFFHNKIMFFGGGFYGMMALLTYGIVEVGEIWQFLGVVFTPGQWFDHLGFDLIIGFIVNSIINLVRAFTWFVTLPDYVTVNNGWIWLLAAYVGYMAAIKLVSERGDLIWAQLGVVGGRAVGVARDRFADVKARQADEGDN